MRTSHVSIALIAPALLSAQALTVMTYNIRYANAHDGKNAWEHRKEAVAQCVIDHGPAIFGLQEVLRDQLEFLKSTWPAYAYFGVGRDDGDGSGEFAPVFFNPALFDLMDGRTIWLSPTCDVPSRGWDATCNRIVTLVILRDRSTGDSLWVANTHWDAVGSEARVQSARIVRELLKDPVARGKRVIFMGDLNARSSEASIDLLREFMFDACPKGRSHRGTFNAFHRLRMFSKRIDYIWLSPDTWLVEHYRIHHPKVRGRQASDHFPVTVRLIAR
jgi:endonuclease/exonuclease/phosphatase family metal-dependent hydrolase